MHYVLLSSNPIPQVMMLFLVPERSTGCTQHACLTPCPTSCMMGACRDDVRGGPCVRCVSERWGRKEGGEGRKEGRKEEEEGGGRREEERQRGRRREEKKEGGGRRKEEEGGGGGKEGGGRRRREEEGGGERGREKRRREKVRELVVLQHTNRAR